MTTVQWGTTRPRSREDINSFIRHSAELTPGKFWVFNNGVSAIVNQFQVDESNPDEPRVTIQGLSIVNGAQTTGSIGSLPQPPDATAFVPVRFIQCSDGETISDIVRFNNSQNPLLPADYKSNDQVQQRLREEFSRIPDSRYTGGRRGLPVDRVSPPGTLLPTDTCAQALAAFHQRPDIAYHRKAEIWWPVPEVWSGAYESTGSGFDSISTGGSGATPGRGQLAANSAGVRYPSELCGR